MNLNCQEIQYTPVFRKKEVKGELEMRVSGSREDNYFFWALSHYSLLHVPPTMPVSNAIVFIFLLMH